MGKVLAPNRLKKIRISLEDRPGNNLFNLINKYKTDPSKEKQVFIALANIITIMEPGHEQCHNDLRNIFVVKSENRKDMEIHFGRYRGCIMQPMILYVKEFDKLYPMINPSISA